MKTLLSLLCILTLAQAQTVTTLAGSGSQGSANGQGAGASFTFPRGVAVDANGNVYVADPDNHLIRKIDAGGNVTTLAGSGNIGNTNGQGTAASFDFPNGVAVDAAGNVYVADQDNHLIRKITIPCPTVTAPTVANATRCGSGGLVLENTATVESGYEVQWSDDENDFSSATAGGNNSFSLSVGQDSTLYVRISNGICTSDTITVMASANAMPALPTISQSGNNLEVTASGVTFRWLDSNQDFLSGATNSSYSPATSGNYYLEVTENNCSDTTEVFNFVATGRVGSSTATFSIYPNPAGNTLYISDAKVNASYTIADLQGRVVQQGTVVELLNISQLSTGVYTLSIAGEHLKFVKQ